MAELIRWRCQGCGEEVVSQDARAVAHLAALHRCPAEHDG